MISVMPVRCLVHNCEDHFHLYSLFVVLSYGLYRSNPVGASEFFLGFITS